MPPLRMEIVRRSDDAKGFVVLPRRWVVECTFSWFGRNWPLAKDFENLAEPLATFVTQARSRSTARLMAAKISAVDQPSISEPQVAPSAPKMR